jgi:hypothetical protein
MPQMTAPDRAAAVEIADDALDTVPFDDAAPGDRARAVVAALDAAKLLRRPDEAEYVAALEKVAGAARPFRAKQRYEYWVVLDRALQALDAVPAAETGSGAACPAPCDDDCEAPCHEAHAVPYKREHDPKDCPASR